MVCRVLKQVMCGALRSYISIEDNSTQAYTMDGPKSRVHMQGLKGSEGCNVDLHSVWRMAVIFIH